MNTLIKEQYNCLYLLMENKGTKIALVVWVYFRELTHALGVNPLCPYMYISIYILHTVLCTFP